MKQKRKRSPAYYRRQELRRAAAKQPTNNDSTVEADEIDIVMNDEEMNEADEVFNENVIQTEESQDDTVEEDENKLEYEADNDIGLELEQLISESKRKRDVWDKFKHPGPEKNFASRNTRLGDQLRWKIEATSRRISFVLQKSIGRIQRNSIFEF